MSSSIRRVAIYARVSTADQDPEVQLRELRPYAAKRGWHIATEYIDHGVSGAKDRRPALDKLLAAARKRKIDLVLVWALDRLGRSLRHLVVTVEEFGHLGIDLVSYTQPIDTTTPAGKLTFAVLGAVAEFERSMIQERVRAGVARARAAGKQLGRPPIEIDPDYLARRIAHGESLRAIARSLGTSDTTIRRALARGATKVPLARASK